MTTVGAQALVEVEAKVGAEVSVGAVERLQQRVLDTFPVAPQFRGQLQNLLFVHTAIADPQIGCLRKIGLIDDVINSISLL
jgi:hypothetical protein